MNTAAVTYVCEECGAKQKLQPGEGVPECCSKAMVVNDEPTGYCTSAPHPEMARNEDSDDPCDEY